MSRALREHYRRVQEAVLSAAPQEGGMDIYHTGYRLRMLSFLAEAYPLTLRCLGRDAFEAAVLGCLRAHPPGQWGLEAYRLYLVPYLNEYMDNFAQSIFYYENELHIVKNNLILDKMPVRSDNICVDKMSFGFEVRGRLVRSDYPVWEWAQRPDRGEVVPHPTPAEPEYLLLYDWQGAVQTELLEPTAFELLHALQRGDRLAQAIEALTLEEEAVTALAPKFSQWFQGWVEKAIMVPKPD